MSNRHRILLQVASISIALALGSACAETESAANSAGRAVNSAANSTANAVNTAVGNYTANNVSAATPFGTMDITPAGTTPQSVGTWYNSRTPAEQAELRGRCSVITNNTYASRYPATAAAFCRNMQTAQNTLPPTP